MARIMIGADVVPTKTNQTLFEQGDIDGLFDSSIIELFHSSDLNIINLETPLTNILDPIDKNGPNLSASEESIEAIKKLHVHVACIGNNHINDQGPVGLIRTMKVLEAAGIAYVGAGKNLDEAEHTLIINVNDLRIGIYSCVEHEFSVATDNNPGANPFEPMRINFHIEELKKETDYIIILFHGGKERYSLPTPMQQSRCQWMAKLGANVVICQHNHCISAYEKYGESLIVYGQGNFLFDRNDQPYSLESILIELNFDKQAMSYRLIPLRKNGHRVRMANIDEAKSIMKTIEEKADIASNPLIVQEKWIEICKKSSEYYLSTLFGFGRLIRLLNRKCNNIILKKIFPKKKMMAIQNIIQCESHQETLKTILNDYIRIL